MRKTLEWLLYESTTILAYNLNMAAMYVAEIPQKYENAYNSSIVEARNDDLTSVAIFPAMMKTMEWLLCESTTILAYNFNMAAMYVAEIPQKYENAYISSIVEARNENLTSIAIFPAVMKTMEWLLCESTTILAYNFNMAAMYVAE